MCVGALSFVACGGDDDDDSGNSNGTATVYGWYGNGSNNYDVFNTTFLLNDNSSVITIYYDGPDDYEKFSVQFINDDTVVLSNRDYAEASGTYVVYMEYTYVRGSRR